MLEIGDAATIKILGNRLLTMTDMPVVLERPGCCFQTVAEQGFKQIAARHPDAPLGTNDNTDKGLQCAFALMAMAPSHARSQAVRTIAQRILELRGQTDSYDTLIEYAHEEFGDLTVFNIHSL